MHEANQGGTFRLPAHRQSDNNTRLRGQINGLAHRREFGEYSGWMPPCPEEEIPGPVGQEVKDDHRRAFELSLSTQ